MWFNKRVSTSSCVLKHIVFAVVKRKKSSSLQWSYKMGPSQRPLLGQTLGQAVDRAADLFGDKEAVVSCEQNVRKSFIQIKEESDKLAAGLLALGFKKGDRVGLWGPNSYEWYITQYAVAKAGLIQVNINPSYRPEELKYCLNKVSVKGIISAEKFKSSNYYEMLCTIVPELPSSLPGQLESREVPHLKTVITMNEHKLSGTVCLSNLFDAAGSNEEKEVSRLSTAIQFDDPCNIQFTSGTTGSPKGAVLSHHNMVNNAYFVGKRCGYADKPERLCVPVPLYHCFGCVAGSVASILFGNTFIMPSAGFDPEAIIKTFKEENISACYGTPTMFVDILDTFRANAFPLEHMHSGIMAGAPCPEKLVTAVIQELKMKDLMVMYGMTETSPVTLQCYPNDDPKIRASTVGCPVDHTEVKVVDENGLIVPVGQSGELWVRGYCNFLGYWEDEQKTSETINKERWLKTGDLVTMDANGYVAIIGRIKDMVIRGGENIYPAELENFYMSHPDILEAQAFGVPDPRMGEEVAMWVRLAPSSSLDPKLIKDWSKGKIAHYKVPKYILIKNEFPSTVTGKIQKFKMREQTMAELKIK